jgi:hypothetical protein
VTEKRQPLHKILLEKWLSACRKPSFLCSVCM